jgi:hypothetical protein
MIVINTKEELLSKLEKGIIEIQENVKITFDIKWDEIGEKILKLIIKGNCDIKGYCDIKGNCDIKGDFFWSHAAMPKIGGKIKIRRVLPPAWQRQYWDKRLGINTTHLCYDEIIEKLILPNLNDWLALDKWTETERWMLESLRGTNG